MPYDYTNKYLRSAAVAYAIQQCGYPRSSTWKDQVQSVASALECSPAELTAWALSELDATPDPLDMAEVDAQTQSVLATEEHELPSEEAGILRAVIEFVGSSESETRWEITTNCIRVPDGGSWAHFEAGIVIHGFPQTGRCGIAVTDRNGSLHAVRLFARVKCVRSAYVEYRQLVPVEHRSDRSKLMRLAILESMIHPDRETHGKRIAEEFGVSKAAVHYQMVKLRDRINAATGGRAGMPGMLNGHQSNYGVPRVGGCNPRANHHQP